MMKLSRSRTALGLCCLCYLAAAQVVGPDQIMKGLEFTRVSARHNYGSFTANQSLSALASTGASWVAIVPIWYQDDTGSSVIYFLPDSSPTDEEIRAVIGQAQSLGLNVFLKPEIRCASGVWQGLHDPNQQDWFHSYTDFILHYARIAMQEHCRLFAIGSELDRAADEPWEQTRWAELINSVKETYPGPVTYAADWQTFDRLVFWDSLDYIGINAYFPIWNGTGQDTFGLMAANWRNQWVPRIESLLTGLQDNAKPVVLTEVGYRSIAGCAARPRGDVEQNKTSETREQRYSYMAVIHSFLGRDWFAGWFFHDWPTDPNQGGPDDVSYTPQGKPAQEVLRRWFAAIGSQRGITLSYNQSHFNFYALPNHAEISLANLARTGAEWVSLLPQGWIDTATLSSAIDVRDTATAWPASPTDSSLHTAIGWARENGLKVVMKPHIDTKRGDFRCWHNPQGAIRRAWFRNYCNFLLRYTAIAESAHCEMMCVGCELDGTANETTDINYWQRLVLPAIRRAYSGPIFYTSLSLDGGVLPSLWQNLDFVGVDAYFTLFPTYLYHDSDTTASQRPSVEDLLDTLNNDKAWGRAWLPRLTGLHEQAQKPIIFPEIGYQPLDSAAWLGAAQRHYGWVEQQSGTKKNLHGVCFPVDTLLGYVVGAEGTILRTTNSGRDWTRCATGTKATLYATQFLGRDTGYAVGAEGTVLRTNNRGSNWTHLDTDHSQAALFGVCFPTGAETGYVVGQNGLALKTVSAGQSWTAIAVGTTANLNSIFFTSQNVGYIVADSGLILRTTDAGKTWARSQPTTVNLHAVQFRDSLLGYAVGDQASFLWTTDAGETWTCRYRQWDSEAHLGLAIARFWGSDSSVYVTGPNHRVFRIFFAPDRRWGFDGSRQFVQSRHRLRGMAMPDSQVGFAVGDSGTILKTWTGGRMRIDFQEQKNCYAAAFQALWRDSVSPNPVPWFYGFHWYDWWVQPHPESVDHEIWLNQMCIQQKPAQSVVEQWFRARPRDQKVTNRSSR